MNTADSLRAHAFLHRLGRLTAQARPVDAPMRGDNRTTPRAESIVRLLTLAEANRGSKPHLRRVDGVWVRAARIGVAA